MMLALVKVRRKNNDLTCGKVYWLLLKLGLIQWHSRGLFGREGENLKITKTNKCEHLRANIFNAIFKGMASKLLKHSNPEAEKFQQEV